jgi:glutamyl-tRNA reductase
MRIAVTGLNHKTAPIDIREKLAFDSDQALRALRLLKDRFPHDEFVLLSTCNRVELYVAYKKTEPLEQAAIEEFLADFHHIPVDDFRKYLYTYTDDNAARHLLTVCSSLDSMVVGEGQIIGQVKESYRLAVTAKATEKVLNRLFHCAFAAGKKVHTTTSIASGRVSVAGVAVELAMQLFADISTAEVVVIGAGEMGELLVQHLIHVGCNSITVVNRTFERGREMASRYGIAVDEWDNLEQRLLKADIAIASATSQDYLFRKDAFSKIAGKRRKGALLVIDIAVPRNFEPSINKIEDVYLYSVDELSEVAEQNRRAREDDIAHGMQIVYENVAEFMEWFKARDIGPMIGQMKQMFEQISCQELERFCVGVREDASCRDVMEPMVNRIVNRLLHCVIKNVNVVAKEHGPAEAAKLVDTIVEHAEEIRSEIDNRDNGQ